MKARYVDGRTQLTQGATIFVCVPAQGHALVFRAATVEELLQQFDEARFFVIETEKDMEQALSNSQCEDPVHLPAHLSRIGEYSVITQDLDPEQCALDALRKVHRIVLCLPCAPKLYEAHAEVALLGTTFRLNDLKQALLEGHNLTDKENNV